VEDFIGEGGTLDWPEAVVQNLPAPAHAGDSLDGYETLGGLRFEDVQLAPRASTSYVLIQAILDGDDNIDRLVKKYGTADLFDDWLSKTKLDWQGKLSTLSVHTGDARFDGWMRWVTLQPILRRLFGNSYLPYHDYGRGGRGWRDLWQDILALLLMQPDHVDELLYGNFAGVRIDGSNATIIGSRPGEFKADRNNIPRMWMDHGAWPFMTTRLYIDQTGDLAFLLRPQVYFKDRLVERTRAVDSDWGAEQGTIQKTASGEVYQGTILEHILIQQLSPFFNVGEHNNILLEGADWNDGMDMARHRGESVAFTAFYASNLAQLSTLVTALKKSGVSQVEMAEEIAMLLDRLGQPIDYESVSKKQALLKEYFSKVRHTLSGKKVSIRVSDLAFDLKSKAGWLFEHLRSKEWVTSREGYGWFNGYYDDDGQRSEGDHPLGVRMTLTGQVFALMGGIASDEQARQVVRSADRYLYEPAMGGYRLNTNFGAVLMNMGRAFGYAFGHKENGAMFSHMAVMYASALYQRGLVIEGHKVLDGIYSHSQDFSKSRIYPGLPEYINPKGRGLYPYLTGSASWFLLTMVTQVFGVRGRLGDLELSPALLAAQFDQNGEASLLTLFAGQKLEVVYHNPHKLEFGSYRISIIEIDHQPVKTQGAETPLIARADLISLPLNQVHRLDIHLAEKS
jgi:cellobiose phosphorylase